MNSHILSIHYTTCKIMYNIIHKIRNTINYLTHELKDYLLKFQLVFLRVLL